MSDEAPTNRLGPFLRRADRPRPPVSPTAYGPLVVCATCGKDDVPVLPYSKTTVLHRVPQMDAKGHREMCPDKTLYHREVMEWRAEHDA